MRLTRINLAGFKSFVDPTHIPVPGQLVGIVGPNGCGKSNVIDAVRWVLGETSAKHLRGETMQDVLFNGSGQRKPVNRASVELIFDNSLGKAAGQWSQYAEISVKRVLERDGDSSYYVNNTHVRRRDITDIFLGTGLGARAYAIIEQGMISRVIEAKPEELRVFLEEAAGVSKYRERRRETESRLKDTRENLLRVDDIRQELGKQLEHLLGQAEVAKQYHALQARLATTQGLLWMTRRQEATAARARAAREIERLAVELEAEAARLREAEKRLEALREEHFRAGDTVHAAQGALYEANAEVARLELGLAHLREKRERIEHQIGGLRTQLGESAVQLEGARQELDEWRTHSTEAAQRLGALDQALEAERAKLPVAEEAYRTTRTRREELQDALAHAEQARHVEHTKLDHAARVLDQLAQRTERLREERAAMPPSDEAELERLREAVRELEALLQTQRGALAEAERSLSSEEQALKTRTEGLDAAGQHETALAARLQALRQLQDRISRAAGVDDWLERRGLGAAPRLWQGISIEAGWEDALEAVLRERLSGVAVSGAGDAARWLADAPPGKLTLVDTADAVTATEPALIDGAQPLRHYVTCRDARLSAVMDEWLHQVHVVPDAAAGLQRRSTLPAGAVMVTRQGHIYTRHSVSFHAPDSELHGVLSRQREIEALEVELAAAQQATAEADAGVALAVAAIEQHKAGIARLREDLAGAQQRCHETQVESVRRSEQAQRLSQRAEQIAAELAEIAEHMQGEVARREDAGARLAEYERTCEQARAEVELAAELYARADSVLKLQREAVQQAQHTQQEATFQARAAEAKIAEVENSIRLLTSQQNALADSLAAEEQVLAGCNEAPWQAQLGAALELKGERERTLAGARDALEEMETRLKSIEQERLTAEQRMAPLRERANEVRLKEQEARLTEDQYTQQLAEAGADEAALAALMEKGMRSNALQGEIARLTEEIRALGAVNLAALEELQSAEARKTYLDMQWQDLTEAMNTLEDAIRRIDRETRERLSTTFEEVNQHFGRMFPALFGGGNAKLVLSGEEILDSGVQVIAQPPGKKNSSIHLLSGGEKALTALALVFALFQLNPAPFCLLDEVDAPLDDYNTQRFCDLVRRMAEHSQFLFISHNKITMEIASQLLGITMQEPGVSRVVAVDIEEAMKLTEEAA